MSIRQAEQLRKHTGELDEGTIQGILNLQQESRQCAVRISEEVFRRYFPEKAKKKEIEETIAKALEAYFSKT